MVPRLVIFITLCLSGREFPRSVNGFSPRWGCPIHGPDASGGGGRSTSRRRPIRAAGAADDAPTTAAARARREEEARRRARREDVVIGRTSAQPGAADLALDPRGTEEAWRVQASEVERRVAEWTEQGLELLKMLRLEEATAAFDRVFELRPETYLWQAGIVRFYLDDLTGAEAIFTRNAKHFEALFGEPASEERIWRNACLLKLYTAMGPAEKKRLDQAGGIASMSSPLRPIEDEPGSPTERRKVMRIAQELFSASINNDFCGAIVRRAKLRAIGGTADLQPRLDRKGWKLNAWYYLGLYFDALGEDEESKRCMKMALRLCPSTGKAEDIVHSLPLIHMSRRDWFDEDEMDAPINESGGTEGSESGGETLYSSKLRDRFGPSADPIIIQSIEFDVLKLRHADLTEALKKRGLPSSGRKEEQQKRIFQSLLEETVGYMS